MKFLAFLTWAIGQLPLPVIRGLGRILARLYFWTSPMSRKSRRIMTVLRTNIRLGRPDLSPKQAEAFALDCLRQSMISLLETFWIWMRTPEQVQRRTQITQGEELLDEITGRAARGEGTVLFGLHGANPDFFSRWLPARWGNTFFTYDPGSRRPWVDQWLFMFRGRGNNCHQASVTGGAAAMRRLYKVLRAGAVGVVWTDMEPTHGSGQVVPAFGALTTMPVFHYRLAQLQGVRGYWCWVKRVPGGFAVSLRKSVHQDNSDKQQALAGLTKELEEVVEDLGTQYVFWTYRRFRGLSDYRLASPYDTEPEKFRRQLTRALKRGPVVKKARRQSSLRGQGKKVSAARKSGSKAPAA